MENGARDRESRVALGMRTAGLCLSRAGHVQPGLKQGSPLPKAIYTQRPIVNRKV